MYQLIKKINLNATQGSLIELETASKIVKKRV